MYDNSPVIWQIEEIPNEDNLFRRLHKDHFINGELTANAFSPYSNDGVSVNWSKYSTPESTRNEKTNPMNFAVGRLNVGEVREENFRVAHNPRKNRAHSLIVDSVMDVQFRLKLLYFTQIVIPL